MEIGWLEQRDSDVPEDNTWLGPNELARLGAMRFPKRRADWRLGRWTAKCAVAPYLQTASCPEEFSTIEICAAPDGAPEVVAGGRPAALSISLSHREGVGVCVVAQQGTALGCDLEIIEPHTDAFIADYFTAEEQKVIARASDEDRFWLVALLWSAKESALKALREGLRIDTRCVEVVLDDEQPAGAPEAPCIWHPLQARYMSQTFHGWWQQIDNRLTTVVAAPPSATLVVPRRIRPLPGFAVSLARTRGPLTPAT
jgi:4'-phosphopantetheinyl transferase